MVSKWYGKIGYADTVETAPGIHTQQITERSYYGELVRNTRKLETSGNVNDNLNISNEISIIADPFARDNFHRMCYIEFMGALWKITSVEVRYPRLILTVGGVYNGEQA